MSVFFVVRFFWRVVVWRVVDIWVPHEFRVRVILGISFVLGVHRHIVHHLRRLWIPKLRLRVCVRGLFWKVGMLLLVDHIGYIGFMIASVLISIWIYLRWRRWWIFRKVLLGMIYIRIWRWCNLCWIIWITFFVLLHHLGMHHIGWWIPRILIRNMIRIIIGLFIWVVKLWAFSFFIRWMN